MTIPQLIPQPTLGDRVIEVVHDDTGEIAKRSIVTDWTERSIDKLYDGLMRRIDHEHWHIVDRVHGAD